MNDLPRPKFNIGDRVFTAFTHQTMRQLPCPDCLGNKTWRVISPAGKESTTPCPRCESHYHGLPSLNVPHVEASVRSLTIGSIQINTADYDHAPVKYMCRETGVGSGSVYEENDLFLDEAEATRVAEAKAEAETQKANDQPQAIEAIRFSYLRIDAACYEALRSAVFHSWYAYQNLMEKLTDYLSDDSNVDKDDLRSKIEFEKSYRQGNSSHPFDVLIRAAKKYADDQEVAKALIPFTAPQKEPCPEEIE